MRHKVAVYNAWHGLKRALGSRPAGFAEREEELLGAARAATGLSEFGGGAWREGLRVLLRCYDEEARLTPWGRASVEREIVGILCARLLTEAGWRENPACLGTRIERPVFILGLPRTGTTALHYLLGEDPAQQVLEFWLAAAPGPRPPRERWQADPRFQAAAAGLAAIYELDPSLKAIHLMTVDGPEECRHLFQQSFQDDTFDSNATIPSYTEWFARQDVRPAYARHRDVLKLIGSPTPERRWVLKYPVHLRHLDVVTETYPEARFVWTHRDPARVLPSICSLVRGWRSLAEGRVDPRWIGSWQLEMWARILERGIEKRRAIDPSRFFDLDFRELVSDPLGAVKRLYDHFGFELSEAAERRMRAWHAANPQGRHGGHRYTAETFGLSDAAIAERFAGYCGRFGIERERAE